MEHEFNSETGKYKCPFCVKEYGKKGIGTHIWRSHGKGKNFKVWNKGLNKENDERIRKLSNTLKSGYESGRKIYIPKNYWLGKKHSEETKKKISESRINFLKENPDKIPYVLNHYSYGESYPEKYFRKIFEKEGLKFIQEKREGLYSLDFVFGVIDLEIDGEQHYLDERIIESDMRRTEFLKSIGYEVKRVRWSSYKKLTESEKKKFINELISKISI